MTFAAALNLLCTVAIWVGIWMNYRVGKRNDERHLELARIELKINDLAELLREAKDSGDTVVISTRWN